MRKDFGKAEKLNSEQADLFQAGINHAGNRIAQEKLGPYNQIKIIS